MYKRFNIEDPFAQFIASVFARDNTNPFVKASNDFPNIVPSFDNFTIVDESKEIMRKYNENDIINNIQFNDIILPYIPDENDIFAVYDTYTIKDEDNHKSIINFNFFYNPSISNFMKMCRIFQNVVNEKIVFTEKYMFIDHILADMLRRIRFVSALNNNTVYTTCIMFNNNDVPIVDTIVTEEDYDKIIAIYGHDLYDCENGDIEVVVSEVSSGDYDNQSQIGNKMTRNTVNKMEIISESDDYMYDLTFPPEDITDAQRLQAFWTFCSIDDMRKKIKKTREFNKWKRITNNNDISDNEFIVKLLRNEVPLNTDDVNGFVIFNGFDVIDFMDLNDNYPENTDDILADFNSNLGANMVFDDSMPYEVAYPDVFDYIKDILNIE